MGLFTTDTTNTTNTTDKHYTTDGLPVNEANKDNNFTNKNNDCRSERNFQNPNCKNYGKSPWPFGGNKAKKTKKSIKTTKKAKKHRRKNKTTKK